MSPGESFPQEGSVELNEGRETTIITVANTGDRPVQVGSHFHFFETNRALKFDREKAYGMRLNIPAGTSVLHGDGMDAVEEWVRTSVRDRRWTPATSTSRPDHHDHDHPHPH